VFKQSVKQSDRWCVSKVYKQSDRWCFKQSDRWCLSKVSRALAGKGGPARQKNLAERVAAWQSSRHVAGCSVSSTWAWIAKASSTALLNLLLFGSEARAGTVTDHCNYKLALTCRTHSLSHTHTHTHTHKHTLTHTPGSGPLAGSCVRLRWGGCRNLPYV